MSTSSAPCCSATAAASTAPIAIVNVAGLSSIGYRIGTFGSFRAAMLDAVSLPDLLASSATTLASSVAPGDSTIAVVDPSQFPLAPPFRVKVGEEYVTVIDGVGTTQWRVARDPTAAAHAVGDPVVLSPANPFANWHPRITGDYQTMFVELWAYLADILTFYQERIANEAFLQTATQRDSMLRLATLVDYHPSPGSGADGLVAFTAAKNQIVTVPSGFRVGSRATPLSPAITYETVSAITASGENSQIPLSPTGPDVDYPANAIVLQGINNGLAVNDYVLAVDGEPATPFLLQLTAVTVDKVAGITTLGWAASADGYNDASKQVQLYAFRTTAAPFGTNAPAWDTLSPTLTNSDGKTPNAPYDYNWDQPNDFFFDFESLYAVSAEKVVAHVDSATLTATLIAEGSQRLARDPSTLIVSFVDPANYYRIAPQANPWFYIPMPGDPDGSNTIFLDSVYSDLKYSAQNPGWAVVMAGGGANQVLQVTQARQVAKTGYTITTRITRLQCTASVNSITYPLRDTTVLTGSELLPLQQDLPLPSVLSGSTLILSGVHTQLVDGQTILLTGSLYSGAPAPASESCVLDGAPAPDPANGVTVLQLKQPLTHTYLRSTCSVMGNIVEVSQGETVKDETLGSGNGTAYQAFALKNKPLTYLPSTDPDGSSPVESTLMVIVNGVEWTELQNLAESAPHDQVYTVATDNSGQSTVLFGDGFQGACPPSGVGNVHARYRKGLGSAGNVAGGIVAQLVDSLPNLQKVTNPSGFSGGSDAESVSSIRTQAPSSLRTFGRAVSVADYAALALSYPGIAKASASLVQRDPLTGLPAAHPSIQLTVATSNQASILGTPLAGKLRQFLDGRRDPNVLLRILDSQPAYISLAVEVDIDSRYPHQATLNAVQAALNPGLNPDGSLGYFAFDRLSFGQAVYLSEVYAIVQGVSGVLDANVTDLHRVTVNLQRPLLQRFGVLNEELRRPVSGFTAIVAAPADILVCPTEIVTINAAFPGSGLSVTGQGGFADL